MGWLPLVGSLKLHISLAEYRLFYRALLQKRPIILRSLLIAATPQLNFWDITSKFSGICCSVLQCVAEHCRVLQSVAELCNVWAEILRCFTSKFSGIASLKMSVSSLLVRDSFICVTWRIHMCDVIYSHVWHDSFMCVTWLIHMCDVTYSYVWRDSFICITWLIHVCDVTHSYVWHDSLMCVTYLAHMCDRRIHVCDMTHSYVWHDSFICVTWLIHMCDMTHSYVW